MPDDGDNDAFDSDGLFGGGLFNTSTDSDDSTPTAGGGGGGSSFWLPSSKPGWWSNASKVLSDPKGWLIGVLVGWIAVAVQSVAGFFGSVYRPIVEGLQYYEAQTDSLVSSLFQPLFNIARAANESIAAMGEAAGPFGFILVPVLQLMALGMLLITAWAVLNMIPYVSEGAQGVSSFVQGWRE